MMGAMPLRCPAGPSKTGRANGLTRRRTTDLGRVSNRNKQQAQTEGRRRGARALRAAFTLRPIPLSKLPPVADRGRRQRPRSSSTMGPTRASPRAPGRVPTYMHACSPKALGGRRGAKPGRAKPGRARGPRADQQRDRTPFCLSAQGCSPGRSKTCSSSLARVLPPDRLECPAVRCSDRRHPSTARAANSLSVSASQPLVVPFFRFLRLTRNQAMVFLFPPPPPVSLCRPFVVEWNEGCHSSSPPVAWPIRGSTMTPSRSHVVAQAFGRRPGKLRQTRRAPRPPFPVVLFQFPVASGGLLSVRLSPLGA
ncbi:hypothetical protein CDD83_188 [Cordyceps sp. RAO-2017]|nr:hypothetical protein CDD83_188 [Cordyceps sp. RAO-2017]